jgi:hypothetical protein
MPQLYSCCVTCIACISEIKYMFCLTENLQFFLHCNTVSISYNSQYSEPVWPSQLPVHPDTTVNKSKIQRHYFHQVNISVFIWGCQQWLSERRLCIQCGASVFKIKRKFLLLTGDVLHYFPVDSIPTTWNCHSVQMLKSVGKTWFNIHISNKSIQHPPCCRTKQLWQIVIQHWKRINDYTTNPAYCNCNSE